MYLRLFISSSMYPALLLFLYSFLFQINRQCWCQRFSTGQNMADALQCSHLSSCGVGADGDQWDFGLWTLKEMLWGRGSSQVGASWLEWMKSSGGWG